MEVAEGLFAVFDFLWKPLPVIADEGIGFSSGHFDLQFQDELMVTFFGGEKDSFAPVGGVEDDFVIGYGKFGLGFFIQAAAGVFVLFDFPLCELGVDIDAGPLAGGGRFG